MDLSKPENDAAFTWAGALAIRLPTISKAELQAVWQGEEGLKHRSVLKAGAPEILRQLANHVRDRVEQIAKETT